MQCPRCGKSICDCLLEDPGFLARAVGKQLRLSGSEAQGLATLKSDTEAAEGNSDDQGGEEPRLGITARAIAGDSDHRRENDAYYTPPWAIDSLLAVEKFEGLTWEPAEGDGRIVAALRHAGCEAIGSDAVTGTDFLATIQEVDNIVTNPPWGLKTEFIRHAKECARRKVALLLPLSALSGVARRPLFEDTAFPLRALYVFDRRLQFDPNSQGSTTLTTGWFVWERGYIGEPVVRWLPESQTDTRHRPEPSLVLCDTTAITNSEDKPLSALRIFIEAINNSGHTQAHVRWLWKNGMGFSAEQFDTYLALLPESHKAMWELLASA
jgi:hypothetical protein